MLLPARELPFEVPSYSLTGDILAFQTCGLQYRYYSGSSLPPSRPVQIWTGEFVHGALEDAYRLWRERHFPFPWPSNPTPFPAPNPLPQRAENDIGVIGDRVEARLAASGKRPRNRDAREAVYRRVTSAINELGPHLFPLITAAEERISGTRAMPEIAGRVARGDRYELTGIVDVISSVQLDRETTNPLVRMLQGHLPNRAGVFDIIVDYKASRRPSSADSFWVNQQWQVQTYAWLREQSATANPIGAGVIVYVDELAPSATELTVFKEELEAGTADVAPPVGSADWYAIHRWRSGAELPELTFDFRLNRAVRIINVSRTDVDAAVHAIDGVVERIESSAVREFNTGDIVANWSACGGETTCVACDFRTFCPEPHAHRGNPLGPRPASAPG